jgi:Arc/MetJ-type ribon-helix-helix transcriptional regulator
MKSNTKSSITLPASELELVNTLMKSLKAKSKVEVIRRGLTLLKESTDRKSLRDAFKKASEATQSTSQAELHELDNLIDEGLDE